MKRKNVIIMGAAGRDFHNFLVYFKNNPNYKVVAFTATQILGMEKRVFPKDLAGKFYRKDIKIYPENKLAELIKKYKVHMVVFAYSDISNQYVMDKASIVLSSGADFVLMGPDSTMIKSKKPLISVCAIRTGAGKSQTTRKIAKILKDSGKKVAIIRHPMPYGDLKKQEVQRFATYEDLKKNDVTIEEREEYEPHINNGFVVYAGVDYEKILRLAEKEADIILFDGGNNDFSFYKSNLYIVVTDPHRAGHELTYHPGETNFLLADIIVINKMDSATPDGIKTIMENTKKFNPDAIVIKAKSPITVDKPQLLKGKKALVIEDGPTLTHGGMAFGAGTIAAKKYRARIVSAEKYAVGSIKEIYKKYKHLKNILPAMGYSKRQIKELEITINNANCDVIIDATPVNLSKLIRIKKPIVNVEYYLDEIGYPKLENIIKKFLKKI